MKYLKILWKTMKFLLLVFCIFLGTLCFRQIDLPAGYIEGKLDSLLGEDLVLHLEGVSFGFQGGLIVKNVRVYNRQAKEPTRPMASAEAVKVDILTRTVTLTGAVYDRLPDGYYEPGYAYADRSKRDCNDPPWDITLPDLPPFTLILEHPNGVGACPEHVVGTVNIEPKRVDLTDIRLRWPRRNGPLMTINGYLGFDIAGKRIYGEIEGTATQAYIRPLLEVLDVQCALPYVDAFTEVEGPIPAYYSWDADLETGHTVMVVKVRPTLGRYNNVKMHDADGRIKLEFWYENGGFCYDATIGPLLAHDRKERTLEGQLVVQGRNEVITLVMDATSELEFSDTLNIIDTLNGGLLSEVKFPLAPKISVNGSLAPVVERQSENKLLGKINAPAAVLWDIPLSNAALDFSYIGPEIVFTNVNAVCARGGSMKGWTKLTVPMLDAAKARLESDVHYRNGALEEVADFFEFDLGDKKGRMEGDIHIEGPMSENFLNEANGAGYVKIEDGHLAQMKLFAGLTKTLAEYIPGVKNVVNQNTGKCNYTLEGGKFKTRDLLIEGDVFSIRAEGEYDIVKDDLNFVVSVTLLREQSLVGKYILHPLLWPFTKSLLEFKVKGPIDNPDWSFVNLFEKEWIKSEKK